MMIVDDQRPPLESWEGWKPQWNERKAPHGLQERHSPTEGAQSLPRRRIVDARLWAAMAPAQQDAAAAIALSYESMGRGMGYVQSNWARIPGARGRGDVGEMHMRLIGHYVEWTKACQRGKIAHAAIIDVLVFGQTLSECDKNRRVRKGWARQNLLDGLALYCRMKGWTV